MALTTKILTTIGTLGCAAAIGFFMQSLDATEKRNAAAVGASNSILEVDAVTLTSADLISPVSSAGIGLTTPEAQAIKAEASATLPQEPEAAIALACDMVASARPVAAAMVKLSLNAPCLPNERVTIHHNGMIFTQVTSDSGTMNATIPALSQDAVFIVAFTNGEGAVAQTTVEELADFDRMVLQWKGGAGFEIHAREFGADYGGDGHIWWGAPGDPVRAITRKSGFVTRLGDPNALLAEVYSFPVTAMNKSGTVDLTVETEVTPMNCGREIEAQTIEVLGGGEMKTRNISLSVPECDAAGTFLVLNNLLQDLKVAAN